MVVTSHTPTERTHKHERADRVRHLLLAGSLVLGPALLAVNDFMMPRVDWDNEREVIVAATAQPGLWQAANLLGLFGFMLLVPAIVAAAELIRSRYPGLALSAVILVSASAMVIAAAILWNFMLAGAAGLDAAVLARFWTQANDLTGFLVLLPFFFTAVVGYLFLAFGLWRTRATPRWVPVLFVGSFAVSFIVEPGLVAGLASVGMAVASAGMAWAYLRSDEEPTPTAVPKVEAVAAA